MKKKFFWRILLIAAATVLSLIYFLPSTSLFPFMPQWWKNYMPDKGIVLGLDLQGGVHLVFEVEGDKAVDITLGRIATRLQNVFRDEGLEAEVKIDRRDLIVKPSNDEIRKIIKDNYPNLNLREGSQERVVYSLTNREINTIKESSVEQALETIRNRIDQFGVSEPIIHKQSSNEIVVQLPGVKDTRRAIDLIGKTAILEFKLLDDENTIAAQLPASVLPGEEEKVIQDFASKIPEYDGILFGRDVDKQTQSVIKRVYLVKKQALLTGDLLTEAKVNIDTLYNEPYVSISFNSAGAKLFEQVTEANVQKRLAIILDNNVYSAPVIKERISGGNAQISGAFSMDEARDLAIVLRSGSLKAPLKMLQNVTVGPSLGRDSIDAGVKAGIIGAILVVIFMIVYYKLSGVIADFALVLNIILLVGVLSMFNATLTLPGIAGVILAVGMAVDSNVLMFERIREELRLGKTPRAAIDSGYDKAFWTIFDSHVTTLITAVVLFQFGTGPIKGFAVTLGWGVFINLFTALIGTKTVFDLITSRTEIKSLSI
ncbi:MAG: protein translocase subunit SecD [Thermodesulfovibrionia bacterium]|nr:protein translocase subunit SecD [Thermodesulfovibrionia bacterium]